jgi:DNA primase
VRRTCGRSSISLDEIERGPDAGVLRLPGGQSLEVGNLRKVFWPKLKITKGDLLRHYVRVSPFLLPVLRDRPLIMKRFPNGVAGGRFTSNVHRRTFPQA